MSVIEKWLRQKINEEKVLDGDVVSSGQVKINVKYESESLKEVSEIEIIDTEEKKEEGTNTPYIIFLDENNEVVPTLNQNSSGDNFEDSMPWSDLNSEVAAASIVNMIKSGELNEQIDTLVASTSNPDEIAKLRRMKTIVKYEVRGSDKYMVLLDKDDEIVPYYFVSDELILAMREFVWTADQENWLSGIVRSTVKGQMDSTIDQWIQNYPDYANDLAKMKSVVRYEVRNRESESEEETDKKVKAILVGYNLYSEGISELRSDIEKRLEAAETVGTNNSNSIQSINTQLASIHNNLFNPINCQVWSKGGDDNVIQFKHAEGPDFIIITMKDMRSQSNDGMILHWSITVDCNEHTLSYDYNALDNAGLGGVDLSLAWDETATISGFPASSINSSIEIANAIAYRLAK